MENEFVQIIVPEASSGFTYVGKARSIIEDRVIVDNVARFNAKQYKYLGQMIVNKSQIHSLSLNSAADLPLIDRYGKG